MRIEGRDDQRAALGAGARARLGDHRLVAAMEAIEIAERDHGPAQTIGQGFRAGQRFHGAGL